jgi:L-seryl-tRNA(Ser) seleniumtransferase
VRPETDVRSSENPALPSATAAEIPSVDRLLSARAFQILVARHGRTQVTAAVRGQLQELRRAVLAGDLDRTRLAESAIATAVEATLAQTARLVLRPVFNLTGTVLHTGLGRALLPEAAVRAVVAALTAPVNLELDLATGRRGERDSVIEAPLRRLTGAPAATVVNNNAAAILLMLSVLANRREVIVSRGELIEIGGSFRLPDIMRRAGARLVEVGTTNRTHLSDYADAITARSALLLKVHTSNYAICGFTASVPLAELVALGRARGVTVAVDLGSGSLVDLRRWHLPAEPTAQEAIAAGADLVAFSGDKLLGGPQAGLIVGRADLIGRLRADPLKRALRVSKLTLAALEAVLALYRDPEHLAQHLTTLRLLIRPAPQLQAQAARLRPAAQRALGDLYKVEETALFSQVGSGALPLAQLPGYGLAVRAVRGRSASVTRLDAVLRTLAQPVIGRLADRTLWLDVRCLEPADEAALVEQLGAIRMAGSP